MSQFTVYLAPSLNVFEFLASCYSSEHCVLPIATENKSEVFHFLSDQSLSNASIVKNNVAWPVSLHSVVVTGSEITPDLLDALIEGINDAILAILPIKKTMGCQSIEIKLNKTIDIETLHHLNQSYCVDLNVVSRLPNLSQPGLVVLDMDSTSIEIECIDEIATLAGVGDEVSQITELAMQGKLDFSQSLRARVSKLKGVKLSLLDVIANDLPLMSGMKELVEQFKAHQWKVAIASGGFTYFADNLKDLLGLDEAVSNTLAHDGEVLTGELVGQIVDAQVKATTVIELARKYDIPLTQTIAIGDGANDLVMMKQAALGVAFHAKAIVQQQADVSINQGDLRSVIGLLSR